MKKIVFLLFASIALFFACKNDIKKEVKPQKVDIQKLQNDIVNLRLGSYIKTPELQNGKLVLTFVKDFAELKQVYPGSLSTEENYKKSFSKKFEIEKAMAEIPAKIMKEYTAIQSIDMFLSFSGKNYSLSITRDGLEKFAGNSLEEIDNDWNKNFAEKFVFTEDGRKKYFEKFVKVQ